MHQSDCSRARRFGAFAPCRHDRRRRRNAASHVVRTDTAIDFPSSRSSRFQTKQQFASALEIGASRQTAAVPFVTAYRAAARYTEATSPTARRDPDMTMRKHLLFIAIFAALSGAAVHILAAGIPARQYRSADARPSMPVQCGILDAPRESPRGKPVVPICKHPLVPTPTANEFKLASEDGVSRELSSVSAPQPGCAAARGCLAAARRPDAAAESRIEGLRNTAP